MSTLRDGYQWGADGRLSSKHRDKEAVAQPDQESTIRIGKAPAKAGRTKAEFDPDYVPLLASEREARRGLLYPWRFLIQRGIAQDARNRILTKIDPYVAEELHRQEERDRELRDAFDALFGQKTSYHVALLLEARFNNFARRELEEILARLAVAGDDKGIRQFLQAMSLLRTVKRHGGTKVLKATVLMFVLGRLFAGQPKPTRAETDQVIAATGYRLGNDGRNMIRDIYSGPILGYLAHRVGRPRKAQKNSS